MPTLSTAWTVKVIVPVAVGVPLMFSVFVSPSGIKTDPAMEPLTLLTVSVMSPVPPLAVMVWLYTSLTVPPAMASPDTGAGTVRTKTVPFRSLTVGDVLCVNANGRLMLLRPVPPTGVSCSSIGVLPRQPDLHPGRAVVKRRHVPLPVVAEVGEAAC